MVTTLVYGLNTNDASYLSLFYPSRRLAEAARDAGIDYRAVLYPPGSAFEPVLGACEGRVALLRGELPMALYEALENRGVTVVNSSTGTALARDKLALARFFSGLGIAHPRTEGFAAPERGAIGSAPLPFPFVAKPRWGKMGRGVALIGDSDSWNAYMAGAPLEARGTRQAPEGSYIAQEYVASTHGRDLRFFFARWPGKRPWLCVERRGGGFLSNAHAGGHMEAFDPPPALARDAERAFAESGLVYGTVDFLFDDTQAGGFSACELNACPGFEELEKATGADAAGAVLKAALSGRIMT